MSHSKKKMLKARRENNNPKSRTDQFKLQLDKEKFKPSPEKTKCKSDANEGVKSNLKEKVRLGKRTHDGALDDQKEERKRKRRKLDSVPNVESGDQSLVSSSDHTSVENVAGLTIKMLKKKKGEIYNYTSYIILFFV